MDFLIYIRVKFREMASIILRTPRKTSTDFISILLLVLSLSLSLSYDYSKPSCQNNYFYDNVTEISTANHLDGDWAGQISLLTSTTTQSLQVSDENPPFHSTVLPQSFIFGSIQAVLSRQAIKRLRFTDILNQLHHHFFFF